MEYSEKNFIPSALNFIPAEGVRFHNNTSVTKPRIRKGSIAARNLSRCKIDLFINCKKIVTDRISEIGFFGYPESAQKLV